MQKALSDIATPPPGTLAPQHGTDAYDYSHVLEDAHQKAMPGAKIVVNFIPGHYNEGEDPHGWLTATLHDGEGKKQGLIHGDVYSKDRDGRKFLGISTSDVRGAPREHQGRRLYWGRKLYEAMMAHAKNKLGATHIGGGAHSTYASLAHRWLADRHGMLYDPVPNLKENMLLADPVAAEFGFGNYYNRESDWGYEGQPPESTDDRYGPYAYTLKNENSLIKAEELSRIPVGPEVQPRYDTDADGSYMNVDHHFYDYDHLLTPAQRDAGYHLEVQTHLGNNEGWDGKGPIAARVWQRGMHPRDYASTVEATCHGDSINVNFAKTNPGHREQKLGRAAYEALFAHAKNHLKAHEVTGGEHSTAAHIAHKAIATKYGLNWIQTPKSQGAGSYQDPRHSPGSFDYAFSPYALKLHELVSDSVLGVPLAKEEDTTDPFVTRILAIKDDWYSAPGQLGVMMAENGFEAKHLAAAIRILGVTGLDETRQKIISSPLFSKDVFESATAAAATDNDVAHARRTMLDTIVNFGGGVQAVAQNADYFLGAIHEQKKLDEAKSKTDAHLIPHNWKARAERNEILLGINRMDQLSDESLATITLDHANDVSRQTRESFLSKLSARYLPTGNFPDGVKKNVLEYSKKLLNSFEKSKNVNRTPGSTIAREATASLPHIKKVIETGLPEEYVKGRLSKNLFHSLLATTAPNYPEKKRAALLEHFTGPEAAKKANNTAASSLVAGLWMSSPHLTDDHFNSIVNNYAGALPLADLVTNSRFTDSLAKKLWSERKDRELLKKMSLHGKMTPEFGLFAVESTFSDPEAKKAEMAAALVAARARSSTDKRAVQNARWNADDGVSPQWYADQHGILHNAYGERHPSYKTNPYTFRDDIGTFMSDLGAAGWSPAIWDKYMDRLNKVVSWRPEEAALRAGETERTIYGVDSYDAGYLVQKPYAWRYQMVANGIQVAPEIDNSLAKYLVDYPHVRQTGEYNEFLRKTTSEEAIHHILSNATTANPIAHILERQDVKPEWLAAVEARPEFAAPPPDTDTRFASPRNTVAGNSGKQSPKDFHAQIRRAVVHSPAFPSERLAGVVAGAKSYDEVTDFLTHKGWNSDLDTLTINMKPTVFGDWLNNPDGTPAYDEEGNPLKAVVTPGTVPWDKNAQGQLLNNLLYYRYKNLTPEHWNQLHADGHLDFRHYPDNTARALESPTLPSNIINDIYSTASANPVYGSASVITKVLAHPNADPGIVNRVVEDPAVVNNTNLEPYRAILKNPNLTPAMVKRMIQRAREVMPEFGVPDPNLGISEKARRETHGFYNTLARSPHAPEDWLDEVAAKMNTEDQTLGVHPHYGSLRRETDFGRNVLAAIGASNPDKVYTNIPQIQVRPGSHPWRKLRDAIEANGGTMHLADIQKDPLFSKLPVDKARVMRDMTPEELARIPEKNRPKVPVKKKTDFVSSEGVQKIIDSLPTVPFNISTRTYSGAQRHDPSTPDQVFQLNITTDHIKKLRDAGLYPTYQKLRQILQQNFGGHPMTEHTIGWIRHGQITPMPSLNIDEIQSDIRPPGGSWVAAVKGAKEHGWRGQAINYVAGASNIWGGDMPAADVDKVMDILWGKGNDPHKVMVEALHQHLRDQGHHNLKIFYPDLGIQGTMRYGWSGLPPDTPMPHPGDPNTGVKAAPKHMEETHMIIPKELGYDMNSAKYGDEPTQINDRNKGWPYHTSPVRKAEDLIKGIETLPSLPFSHVSAGDRIYDASHYLTPEHKRLGYTLKIRTGEGPYGPYSIADVHHGAHNIVGGASMYVNNESMKGDEKRKYAQFDMVGLKDQHVGKRLGLPMYEALLASAKKHWGCTHVRGLQHSSMAHSVHKQLADKHGLKYEAAPNVPSAKYANLAEWERTPKGAMDAKWGPYSYTL